MCCLSVLKIDINIVLHVKNMRNMTKKISHVKFQKTSLLFYFSFEINTNFISSHNSIFRLIGIIYA